MPLDGQIADLLERVNALPPMSSGTPEAARKSFRRLTLASAAMAGEIEVGSVEDLEVGGGDCPLAARLYRPAGADVAPTLVFFHGGGFVIGDVDSYDAQCRRICSDAETAVLSVEYRRAPEDPFPAAADDAVAATAWALENPERLGGDARRIAVGGDSAGGNLAAGAAQALRGHERSLSAQFLLYPVVDFSSERPSHKENGEGLFLTGDDMTWFREFYVGDSDRTDPRMSPLLADDLSGLPPAVVITAEFDPLRDDGEAYAEALTEAGVPVVSRCFDGLIHGFFAMGNVSTAAATAIGEVCAMLRGELR